MDSTCEAFLVPDLLAGPTDSTCKAFETQTQDVKQHVVWAVWTTFKCGSAIPQWPEPQTRPAVWFHGVTEPEPNFWSGLEFEPGLLRFWTGLRQYYSVHQTLYHNSHWIWFKHWLPDHFFHTPWYPEKRITKNRVKITASKILDISGDWVPIVPKYKDDAPIAGASWTKSLAKTKLIPSKGLLYGIFHI